MSGTRAKTIRAAIATGVRSVTLDARAGAADRFVHIESSRRLESARPRSFRVFASVPPHRSDLQTNDAYRVEFTVELYFELGQGIDDRICDDCERFWWVLETLQSIDSSIMLADPSHLGVEETQSNLIVRFSVVVTYRLDSALVA